MSFSAGVSARADASCRRCNRRKKKCDRTLPECETCRRANVACSFLHNDSQVASYPVIYVQNLELRVKELEGQLARLMATTDQQTADSPNLLDEYLRVRPEFDDLDIGDEDRFVTPQITADVNDDSTAVARPSISNSERPDALVDGLRLLSLEATADKYLGSSSGLSFAKLTQSVLRRLSPDKADFVFNGVDHDASNLLREMVNSPSPGLPLSPSALLSGSHTWPETSSLFGPLTLAHFMEEDTVLDSLTLPETSRIKSLTEFYFAHSHTLYPIVRRNEFMSNLWHIEQNPQDPLAQSPVWQFHIWMVLAIGSTSHHTVSLGEESESVVYYNKAMSYFEAALAYGEIAVLEVLLLQVSYSFFNQIGPNTWFLVGVAARIAIGVGLHTSETYANIPNDVAEHRRRLFYSLYMMDRVVSLALGRPFAIHDSDIDVPFFAEADDEDSTPDGTMKKDDLQPSVMAVPLHILALRRIASDISQSVDSKKKAENLESSERDEIVESLHKRLITWRRNTPFPLPDIDPLVPHLCSSWYDFNYYTHITRLYRPSPLLPTLDQQKLNILSSASAMAIREAMNLHRQRRFAYNWLNLLAVFTCTMSLIYTTTVQPRDLATVLREDKAIDDLELAVELFKTFSKKFPAAERVSNMVQEIQRSFRDHRGS